ncbi:MAG: PIG-L family deacetylase [Nanoarchaeota archaeon]|nr:PIG-L family deacetylase [Nanoarchaeota archaeon]MBU1030650.1 PIG-L family deacetylase [Nanoarchaeota archaeon]MBU1849852.1 PIG-L family deacetylase [Nanoarchaeota archaeon]
MKRDTILVICAHSDDQILGPGGTIAKYAKEGLKVKTIIFSLGEMSHPHFQEDIITNTRIKEAQRADKIIGGQGVWFLNIKEKEVTNPKKIEKAKRELEKIISKNKPLKIFTHSPDDAHPVHKVVCKTVLEVYDLMRLKTEIYAFDIWKIFKWKKSKYPKLVVDISATFKIKLEALKCFKSQFGLLGFLNYFPYFAPIIKGLFARWKYNINMSEVFYRIR